jgi:beta-lactamase regulating signal transducer with metallopeptidase domain
MLEHFTNIILFLSAAASGSMVNAVIQGLFLTAAVALFLRVIPGIKPAARFLVWLSVLFAVVALHLESALKGSPESYLGPGTPSFHIDPRWGIPIAVVWIGVSFVRGVSLVRSAIELRRIANSAEPVEINEDVRALLRTRFRSAQLCTSAHVDRPSVAGFLHPRVLLPHDLLQKIPPEQLQQIIVHEMEHLRRFDDWTNLLQKVGLVFFPLNPALMWIERRLCRERELACDDCVLTFTGARKTYATCLTSLAEHTLVRRGVTLALGAWEKQSELSRRIHRILGKPEARLRPVTANVVTGVVIAGLLGGALTLAHTPEIVSFAPTGTGNAVSQAATVTAEDSSASAAPATGPTVQPVKAIVPSQQRKASTERSSTPRSAAVVKAVHHARTPRPQQWVVLTRWQSVAAPRRPVLTVSETTGSSYAAVPVGNGWLIIQL